MSSKIWQFVEKVLRNDAFCGIMPEIAAEKKGSGNPEVPTDIVILFVLMSMAKQDNYKKERTETALSFYFSDFGMRGYISMVKPSGLFLRFSFSFW